ncbi:unnamed protein product [Auanema sp. JU1783]|nr:unnamed protein product [Auanema sp. JU1783]
MGHTPIISIETHHRSYLQTATKIMEKHLGKPQAKQFMFLVSLICLPHVKGFPCRESNPGRVGRFPTLYSGVHRSETNHFVYVCMPLSVDGRNWRNVISQRIEFYPGSLCGKACPALDFSGKGLDVISRPEEFGVSSRLVVGESYYDLQCKPGHKYNSSVHDVSGKQVLFCDPKTGSYIDFTNNNKTQAFVEGCSMVSGSGCPDLSVPNSVITYSNCDNGYKSGCRVTMSCATGYIPMNVKYHETGTQTLICSSGSEWEEENGQDKPAILQCVAACRMDNTTIDANVLISRNTTRKFLVLGVTYILEGDSVFIKCRGDSIIWEQNIELTQQEHLFVCGGGPLGFIRNEDHMSTVQLGEGCVPTCSSLPTSNLGNLNLVVNIPTIVQYLGKSLVANGLEYTFSCKENYMYPSGSSPSLTGLEKFRCDGINGEFINSVTNQVYHAPTACTRSTYLDECIKLISDESRVIQTIYQCHDAGDNFYRAGCSITSKCLPNFMPESNTYYIPSGEQKIICGDGGAGWRDQFGNIISEGFKCVPGCKPYENSHEYIRIHEKTFYINGLKIECKEIDVIKNQTSSHNHPYFCEDNSSNNSTDKGCTNACKQIVTLPAGVEIFKVLNIIRLVDQHTFQNPEPKQLEEGYPYIAGNSEYVLRCQNGFTYESTSSHSSLGRQTLRCNPTTNQYDDIDTNITNARIESCVESQGCQVMTLPPNVLETVQSSGCTRTAGFFSNGCTITYQCTPGFFPSDRYTLYFGSQTAQCSSSNKTWLDRDGNPFTSITTCSYGCANLNLTELVTLQYESTEIFYETFSDLEADDFECYSRSMYTTLIEVIQQVRRNSYICPKQTHTNQTHISGNQELLCKDACPVLLSSGLPEGVQFSKNPIVFNPYNQAAFLGINKTVVLQCQTGYEYLTGSVYSSARKQEFLCDSSLKYFDIQANTFNSVIQPCTQVSGAQAPAASNVNRTKDINCEESNGIYRVGCKLTVKCIEGAYPSNPLYFQLAEQNLELIMDPVVGVVWVDSITRTKVDYLSCSLGCLPLSIINLNITTTTSIARYGSVTARCQLKSEDLSIGLLPNGTARYFCELQGGGTHVNTTSPCTNVCEIPNYDKTLTVRVVMPMAVPFSQYMVLTSPMSALCPPGKQWPSLGQAQRGLVCSENNEVRDSLTNTIVRYITDTCA